MILSEKSQRTARGNLYPSTMAFITGVQRPLLVFSKYRAQCMLFGHYEAVANSMNTQNYLSVVHGCPWVRYVGNYLTTGLVKAMPVLLKT